MSINILRVILYNIHVFIWENWAKDTKDFCIIFFLQQHVNLQLSQCKKNAKNKKQKCIGPGFSYSNDVESLCAFLTFQGILKLTKVGESLAWVINSKSEVEESISGRKDRRTVTVRAQGEELSRFKMQEEDIVTIDKAGGMDCSLFKSLVNP